MFPGTTGCRVLVIEDEAMVAMLLEDMLAEIGCEVAAAAGRMSLAMKLASELAVDFAIVDVNLNGEQTYPLATILANRGIPFVFATGYGAAILQGEWKDVPTLQKPFRARDLAEVISMVRQRAPTVGPQAESSLR